MNYNEIVDSIMDSYVDPCTVEVPPGMYRRVMWEKYNPSKAMVQPTVGEEWDTEIISIGSRLYTSNPFGHKSTPFGVDPLPPIPPVVGVWSDKIAYRFASQSELEAYVSSIGSSMIGSNDWYGADLSKASLFKHPREIAMYRCENSGGVLLNSGPSIDPRTMMEYNSSMESFTSINFSGLDVGQKTKYLMHYEDKPCTYVGFAATLPPDLIIPPIPATTPPIVGSLPGVFKASCIPVTASFPYTEVCKAVVESLGRTRHSIKAAFDNLPGITMATEGEFFATMYDRLSTAAEEAFAGAAAISQYALQAAMLEFKNIISKALSIVGGGWDLIKSFLPSISIAGISFDIIDVVFSSDAVQTMVRKFNRLMAPPSSMSLSELIDEIYAAMGDAYNYATNKVKMKYRDIADAASCLYDWMMAQFQSGCVALCKLLGDLAQIWSIPPLLPGPNPVWIAIKAVREMFSQIPPLDIIMSGNFPGFTATDIYSMVMKKVDAIIEETQKTIAGLTYTFREKKNELMETVRNLRSKETEFSQYLDGMFGDITYAVTEQYKTSIAALEKTIDGLKLMVSDLGMAIKTERDKIKDVLSMGIGELKKLPIISEINKFLSLCGMTIDDIMNIKVDANSGSSTLYEGFVGGMKSIKDYCYTLYNQISTLALSKVTQWVNKLIGIIGLSITFPSITICVPVIEL